MTASDACSSPQRGRECQLPTFMYSLEYPIWLQLAVFNFYFSLLAFSYISPASRTCGGASPWISRPHAGSRHIPISTSILILPRWPLQDECGTIDQRGLLMMLSLRILQLRCPAGRRLAPPSADMSLEKKPFRSSAGVDQKQPHHIDRRQRKTFLPAFRPNLSALIGLDSLGDPGRKCRHRGLTGGAVQFRSDHSYWINRPNSQTTW